MYELILFLYKVSEFKSIIDILFLFINNNIKEVDFSDYLAIGNFDTIDDDNYQNIDNDFVGFF